MVFMGEYEHTIDPKGRMFLPAKYRDALGETVVLIKWPYRRCLYVMSLEEFTNLSSSLNNVPLTDEAGQDVKRRIFSKSTEVEMDTQKRILIPQSFRAFAGLEKEVIVAGVDDHLEIWNRQDYNETDGDNDDLRDAMASLRGRGYSV